MAFWKQNSRALAHETLQQRPGHRLLFELTGYRRVGLAAVEGVSATRSAAFRIDTSNFCPLDRIPRFFRFISSNESRSHKRSNSTDLVPRAEPNHSRWWSRLPTRLSAICFRLSALGHRFPLSALRLATSPFHQPFPPPSPPCPRWLYLSLLAISLPPSLSAPADGCVPTRQEICSAPSRDARVQTIRLLDGPWYHKLWLPPRFAIGRA